MSASTYAPAYIRLALNKPAHFGVGDKAKSMDSPTYEILDLECKAIVREAMAAPMSMSLDHFVEALLLAPPSRSPQRYSFSSDCIHMDQAGLPY